MATSVVQFRIDDDLKEQATEIYDKLGLDLSTAMRISLNARSFHHQLSRRCGLNRLLSFISPQAFVTYLSYYQYSSKPAVCQYYYFGNKKLIQLKLSVIVRKLHKSDLLSTEEQISDLFPDCKECHDQYTVELYIKT